MWLSRISSCNLPAVPPYTDKERKILNIVTVPAAAAGLLYNCAGSLAAGLKVSWEDSFGNGLVDYPHGGASAQM